MAALGIRPDHSHSQRSTILGSLANSRYASSTQPLFEDAINIEYIPDHLHELHLLHLKGGKRVIWKRLASCSKPTLRLERNIIENEAILYTFARARQLPAPKIITFQQCSGRSCKPFLITDFAEGNSYAGLHSSLTGAEQASIEQQVETFVNALKGHCSSRFGPVFDVARGQGYELWAEAFNMMFETLLMDGEDMLIGLPYTRLREQLRRCKPSLQQVNEATLVLPSLLDSKNIILDPDNLTVSAVLDLGWMAVWGDADLMGSHSGVEPKSLLYACFQSTLVILQHHYRPLDRHTGSELDAWKRLNESLMALMAMDCWG